VVVVGGGSLLNHQIAERLREMAELLEQQRANPFRVTAYRRAAETLVRLDDDLAVLLEREGIEGLDARGARWPPGRSVGHRLADGGDAAGFPGRHARAHPACPAHAHDRAGG
jgi:Helix-hairpin-helix domain